MSVYREDQARARAVPVLASAPRQFEAIIAVLEAAADTLSVEDAHYLRAQLQAIARTLKRAGRTCARFAVLFDVRSRRFDERLTALETDRFVSGHQPASSSPGCSGDAERCPFFFYQFVRLLEDVALELQLPDVASKRFDLLLQLRMLKVRRWLLWAPHRCWNLPTE